MLKRIISALIVLASSSAFGWGSTGHQIVAYTGANSTTDGQLFWRSNLESIRKLSTVPDRLWKSSATKAQEGLTHWFEIDSYYKPTEFSQIISFPSSYSAAVSKYTEERILVNGTAPWRIRQLYQLAFQAFKAGNTETAMQYVGVMSHYIGDLSQPLHVSINYDGQLTGNKGLHSYFETSVLKNETAIRTDVQKRVTKLLKNGNYLSQFNGSLMDSILLSVERSVSQLDLVLKNDKQYGRTAKGAAIQLELVKDRLADGAATFAIILNQLWKETGLIANASPLKIADPKFVKPDYSKLID
jgi:S1/P1 Nuclease